MLLMGLLVLGGEAMSQRERGREGGENLMDGISRLRCKKKKKKPLRVNTETNLGEGGVREDEQESRRERQSRVC